MDETPKKNAATWQLIRHPLGRIVIATIGLILIAMVYGATTIVMRSLRDAEIDQCLRHTQWIGLAFWNYIDTDKCLLETEIGKVRPFGWRFTASAFLDAHPIPSDEAIREQPVYIFNLSGRTNPNNQSTTIYAITGDETSFGLENRCRVRDLPGTRIWLISGRLSKGPWHSAENVPLEELQGSAPIRDVIGETVPGVTFLLLSNGEAWAINSSTPCELIARCAEVSDEANSVTALQALLKYRLKVK